MCALLLFEKSSKLFTEHLLLALYFKETAERNKCLLLPVEPRIYNSKHAVKGTDVCLSLYSGKINNKPIVIQA